MHEFWGKKKSVFIFEEECVYIRRSVFVFVLIIIWLDTSLKNGSNMNITQSLIHSQKRRFVESDEHFVDRTKTQTLFG
jgi:hypothetical protein